MICLNKLCVIVIVYNVIRWSLCELKRDLLYFLYIGNAIISQHINANLMEECILMHFSYDLYHRFNFTKIVKH